MPAAPTCNSVKHPLFLALQKLALISLVLFISACNRPDNKLAGESAIIQKYHSLYYNYDFYHSRGKKDKAMLYADSMINLFDNPDEKLKYTYYYGQAYFFKGDIYFDENKYDAAYEYYYQGQTIASNSLDACTLGEYSYRMGMIMYKQEHFRIAAAYFKSSLQGARSCPWNFSTFFRMQELLNNTGLSYYKINEADSALMYFEKDLSFINSKSIEFKKSAQNLESARGVVYGNEANIYINRGNYPLAKNLLKKSIDINLRKNNDNSDAQLSELKLARLYVQENKDDSLFALLQNVHRQFDTVTNKPAEADWNLLMANYYAKHKLPQLAYGYVVKHYALRDSISSSDKKLKEADISEQMERLKKNYEFKALEKDNEQQRYYLDVALILGVMFFIIISLIFVNWRKSNDNVKVLGNLNKQINDQNQNLELALDQLKLSSEEKDRILRTVAHDLRNPVGGIASLTGLMAEESEYSHEQKKLINLIKETSNNSLDLINEILEITDNALVKPEKEKEPVEINELLTKCVELLRFKASEKKQQIVTELIDEPTELLINREKIWRVISNLISNAIKFSPANTLIHIKAINTTKELIITVTDDGIGIPDEIKEEVFNIFTNAKRPGTAGEKSFGLGLSICRQIIENHNGKIWLESNGGGTTFYVSLPIV